MAIFRVGRDLPRLAEAAAKGGEKVNEGIPL
jgi:hypothetical protein